MSTQDMSVQQKLVTDAFLCIVHKLIKQEKKQYKKDGELLKSLGIVERLLETYAGGPKLLSGSACLAERNRVCTGSHEAFNRLWSKCPETAYDLVRIAASMDRMETGEADQVTAASKTLISYIGDNPKKDKWELAGILGVQANMWDVFVVIAQDSKNLWHAIEASELCTA